MIRAKGGIHIAGMTLAWKIRIDVVWRIAGGVVPAQDNVGRLGVILDVQLLCGCLRLFERFGDHEREDGTVAGSHDV